MNSEEPPSRFSSRFSSEKASDLASKLVVRFAHMLLPRTFSIAVLLSALQVATLAADFPNHTGYVSDFSNVLSQEARTSLEELLRKTEAETRAEIAVAIVPSLDGRTIEEYASGMFKKWGIGKEKADNGVLVLVALNEREVRIEVGYGLESVLPDALAGEIIRTDFLPQFRKKDYFGGLQHGVERIVELVKRNQVLTPDERKALKSSNTEKPPIWLMIPFFGLFIIIGFFMLGAGLGSKTGFPLLFGSLFGGVPLLMSIVPFFNASIYVLGPLALAAAAIGFRNGRRSPPWIASMRTEGRRDKGKGGGGRSHGWVMGGSSGGSGSSSSGSSGGGFGGGSSGGGGASGSW